MFGSCCFNKHDLKLTLGTGSFLNINSGHEIHTGSVAAYPLVAWELNDENIYCLESASNDAGSLIQWTLNTGKVIWSMDKFILRLNDICHYQAKCGPLLDCRKLTRLWYDLLSRIMVVGSLPHELGLLVQLLLK